MKKIALFLTVLLCSVSISARDEISRDPAVLPPAAQALIANNFKQAISFVKIDKSFGRASKYEAVLTDGTEVKFDNKGNWTEVETDRRHSVPKYFLPTAMRSYLQLRHKNVNVVGIDKERNGYEVTLADGIEMKFDKNGNFKHYDD